MSNTVIIVESYGKVQTIQKIVGNNYKVVACGGHIKDLDPKKLSIDTHKDKYFPKYKLLPNKKAFLTNLKNKFDKFIIATDADREGAFIGYALIDELKLDITDKNRIIFTEITDSAIKHALKTPKPIDISLVKSQQSRRMLDRLIGYKIQPYLSKGYSVGRVQSAVVQLIKESVDNHRSDLKKNHQSIFTFDNKLTASKNITEKDLNIDYFENIFINREFTVTDIKEKEDVVYPPLPFNTASLQKECFKRFKISSTTTMKIAQNLYEDGYITYIRTSSTDISSDFQSALSKYITRKYTSIYDNSYGPKKKKTIHSQEAHEAIRPTNLSKDYASLSDMDKNVYQLILYNTIMSHMKPAIYIIKNILIQNKLKYQLSIIANEQKFDGFELLLNKKKENLCININDNMKLMKINASEIYTYNNVLFNEGSLINHMEKLSIGRPSTYAYIIDNIIKKGYVHIKNKIDGKKVDIRSISITLKKSSDTTDSKVIGQEVNKLVVEEKGYEILKFLQTNFDRFIDKFYTSEVENRLDNIASNREDHNDLLLETDKYISSVKNIDKFKNKSNVTLLGKDLQNCKLYYSKGLYGPFIKKDYGDNIVQFFSCNENASFKDAIDITENSSYIGMYKKKPIFTIKKKNGMFLTWNKQNIKIPYSNSQNINIEAAKKLIK